MIIKEYRGTTLSAYIETAYIKVTNTTSFRVGYLLIDWDGVTVKLDGIERFEKLSEAILAFNILVETLGNED